jgi:hypothetical protein
MKFLNSKKASKISNKSNFPKFAFIEIFDEIEREAKLGNKTAMIPFGVYQSDLEIMKKLKSLGYEINERVKTNFGMFLEVRWE